MVPPPLQSTVDRPRKKKASGELEKKTISMKKGAFSLAHREGLQCYSR